MSSYILPNLKKYDSFSEVVEKRPLAAAYGSLIKEGDLEFKALFNFSRLIILGEPGFGKTRLLKEVIRQSGKSKKKAIVIDLKLLSLDKTIAEFIQEKTVKAFEIGDSSLEKDLEFNTFLKSSDFELANLEDVVVCLDALDEVKQQDFSKVVEYIKVFSLEYSKITIFVSCRFHHFQKYKNLFKGTSFAYVDILKFRREQVYQYLGESGLDDNQVTELLDALGVGDRDLLVQIPRYLRMVSVIALKKGIPYILGLKKTDLFEDFIYGALEREDEVYNFQKKEIVKRVLEKLALVMEIYQTNAVSKEELITFFDDVKSNLNISFLEQFPIELFYERSLIKDNIETIEFHNTEFQEYLAAKEIARLGRINQVVFDLMVDYEVRQLYPSWFSVLSFLVEIESSVLMPILDFGEIENIPIQDEHYHRLLTAQSAKTLSPQERNEIFKNIFGYYQKVLHYIHDIAKGLSCFYDSTSSSLIKSSIERNHENETARLVRCTNTAYIVRFLLQRNSLQDNEKEFWKQKLLKFANDKNENGVLRQNAILALGEFKNIELLKMASASFNKGDEIFDQDFLIACMEVDPEDRFSIQCFVAGVKTNNIFARYGLEKVKSGSGLGFLLDNFIEDRTFLQKFIEHESIFEGQDKALIKNMRMVLDDTIRKKLETLITAEFDSLTGWYSEHSSFLLHVVLILKESDPDYLFKLLVQIKCSQDLKENLYYFDRFFAELLEKAQVQQFVETIIGFPGGRQSALITFQRIRHSQREGKEDIYEEGRKYLSEEYQKVESYQAEEYSIKQNRVENLHKEFQRYLEPTIGTYNPDVFSFYLKNKDLLKDIVSNAELTRLKKLIAESVFEKFDPAEHELKILKSSDGGTQYREHTWNQIFGDCLRLLSIADEVRMDISKYRQRIINYIPFGYDHHLEAIFKLIPDPTVDEINKLLLIYTGSRDDDLKRFMPGNLVEASLKYNILSVVPILKGFVDNGDFGIYVRQSALNAIAKIEPDDQYFNAIFAKYSKKTQAGTVQLAVDANRHLIERYGDKKAITWRIKQLKKKAFSFTEIKGVHSVGAEEHELRDKSFAHPLMGLKYHQYVKDFVGLLEYSFKLLRKGEKFFAYASYLWDIVVSYFDNLKEYRKYSLLNELEKSVKKFRDEEGINWFKHRISSLKRSYLAHIGRPLSIGECIRKYNELKERQYLEVATARDLADLVAKVVDEDLRHWVEVEGAYKFIERTKGKVENLIQKTILSELKYNLSKRLRPKDVDIDIKREAELLSGKKTDFLISYGFIGPVLIETKRVNNPEITNPTKRESYRHKLLNYMRATKSKFALFLILQTSQTPSWEKFGPLVQRTYRKELNVQIIRLNCVKAPSHQRKNLSGKRRKRIS